MKIMRTWKNNRPARSLSHVLLVAGITLIWGCGGGGGGGSTPPPPPNTSLFLYVNNPEYNNKIYSTSSVTVTGQTAAGAAVTVNNNNATVDSSGNFTYAGLTISSNPFTITVKATKDSDSYTVTRSVYYQNTSQCTLVYSATDPKSGYTRIYDTNPAIPNSTRCISDDVVGTTDTQPALNPSRDTIVFIRALNGNQNLYKITCTGSGTAVCPAAGTATQITSTNGVPYQSVSWSKSGTYIAYSASVGDYDIYTMIPSPGQNPTQITTHPAADTSPTWSADNARIYFISNRPTDGSATGTINYTHLWYVTVSSPGTAAMVTSEPTCPDGVGKCSILNPDISPTTVLIYQFAFSCGTGSGGNPPEPPESTCYNLYYLTAYPPGNPTAATTGNNNLYLRPRWQETSNENNIVFVNRNNSTDALYKIAFTGTTWGTPTSLNLTGGTPDW